MTQGLDGLLEAVPMPALFVGADDRIVAANAAAARLFGQPPAGRLLTTVVRQPTVLHAVDGCRSSLEARTARYLTNDGQQDVTYAVNCGFVALQEGQGVLTCFEDVTHMEQVGQMRRDFVANVSHELRTPLTALLGFIETLRGPARDDAAARERFLGIMEHEAERMNRLVRDLLSLSQVEAEERMRPANPVDIVELVEGASRTLTHLAGGSDVTIVHEMPESAIMVPAEPDQLRQVVTNLVENAIKYGGRGGTVTLSITGPAQDLALRAEAVRICVRDTGPGIDPLHIPRLTERFYRVDSHRSREKGGTGLGLAIVKHIVNRHRGRLLIDSAPGEGSTFCIVLPTS
ncbi:MAG: ATP-binding protein [Sediminimonas sp.]|uniref:sensor histidine kinase n=1 Tax=Sediminimonas sp. TaxID=2823379 RepID=UPI00286FD990|nr:ATP-binding protein [Sediminimonas sp.]MDR9485496.1 ATP-binding protein [Sediminimonas sp.]